MTIVFRSLELRESVIKKCTLCKKEVPVEEWVDYLSCCLDCNQRLSNGIEDILKGNVASTKEIKENQKVKMMNREELEIEETGKICIDTIGLKEWLALNNNYNLEVTKKKWVSVESLINLIKEDSWDESGKEDLIIDANKIISKLTKANLKGNEDERPK